jgi:hypothetical protein
MHKYRLQFEFAIAIAFFFVSITAGGQDETVGQDADARAADGATTNGTTPETQRPEEQRQAQVDSMCRSVQRAAARLAVAEQTIAGLEEDIARSEQQLEAIDARIAELDKALSANKRAHGTRRSGNLAITYDRSADIAKIENALASARRDKIAAESRLSKARFARSNAQNRIATTNIFLAEQQIMLAAEGVDIEPLLTIPKISKPKPPAPPPAKQIYVTTDGRFIAAVAAELSDGYWMLTTPSGKIFALAENEISKIIDRNP